MEIAKKVLGAAAGVALGVIVGMVIYEKFAKSTFGITS